MSVVSKLYGRERASTTRLVNGGVSSFLPSYHLPRILSPPPPSSPLPPLPPSSPLPHPSRNPPLPWPTHLPLGLVSIRSISAPSDFLILYVAGSPGAQSRSPSPSPQDTLTLRALVSTKEAGIIIGKAGKNVADLREQTGVKAGVSKVIPGVHERVLTVTGPVEGVAKASADVFL